MRRMVEGNFRVEPYPFLKCGDWVRVKSGPLMGIEGILVRKKNVFRLVLSVEMLGKSAAVEVDATTVEPIARRSEGRVIGPVDGVMGPQEKSPLGRGNAKRGPNSCRAGGYWVSAGH